MKIVNLNLIDYQEAYQLQKKLVHDVYLNNSEEVLLICHHHPIVTLGKKSKEKDYLNWKGNILNIERGGQATYHGLAINIYQDPLAFKGISPCGMDHNVMTNLSDIIHQEVDRNAFESLLAKNLADALTKSNFSICQAESSI